MGTLARHSRYRRSLRKLFALLFATTWPANAMSGTTVCLHIHILPKRAYGNFASSGWCNPRPSRCPAKARCFACPVKVYGNACVIRELLAITVVSRRRNAVFPQRRLQLCLRNRRMCGGGQERGNNRRSREHYCRKWRGDTKAKSPRHSRGVIIKFFLNLRCVFSLSHIFSP